MLQNGTGAVSRYNYDRSQKSVTLQDFKLRAGAGVRVQDLVEFIRGAGFCKNCDELIDPTVRVSC